MFKYHLLLKIENRKHCNKIIFKYVNSTVDPILMKILWKRVFVGLVNSTWDPLKRRKLIENAIQTNLTCAVAKLKIYTN